ncbi:sugar phosphate nucleotidyltransferase [Marimonas sp. MJW-29]|uniref:UTP--glucose-1-phosphate uridylyltransferase n=1 Tax=Sulfitobacter sediminis TaxID=3234186 RepID=A0ABV3RQR2_9RHOB
MQQQRLESPISPRIRTAIFPVAALGSRFLPATKATPKELLPVIDTPLFQYAIDEAREAGGERMVVSLQVEEEETRKYGMLSVTERSGRLLRADGMVEKPDPADAPSRDAVVGRYVLDGCIFDDLAQTTPGTGREIQLTDSIARGASRVGLVG